jgi:hypothetical protein
VRQRGSPRCRCIHNLAAILAAIVAAAQVSACGKSGPPLPPLVRLPAAPSSVVAERRGTSVDIRLVVPSANTDGTRPANVERVDVYGLTGPASVTDDQILKLGAKIGSVNVKAPRDPNATVEPDDPASDAEPPVGSGLDQGATAALSEELTPAAMRPVDLSKAAPRSSTRTDNTTARPLAGPPPAVSSRVYASVGISTRGRRGPFSRRVAIPLVAAPQPSPAPDVTYDETTITVTWTPPAEAPVAQEFASGAVLPARLIGVSVPTTAYNVYAVKPETKPDPKPDVKPDAKSGSSQSPREQEHQEIRLTTQPVAEARFVDNRLEWGVERCYAVRVARTFDGLTVESDASPPRCVTPVDKFPPKPPTGLQAIASEGAISLIWEPNTEKDLAGYIVLRAIAPSGTMAPVTPMSIQATTLRDPVQPGVSYVYAVQAVDKAGNTSVPSSRSEETEAR